MHVHTCIYYIKNWSLLYLAGVKQLKKEGVKIIYVDPCGDPEGKI